MLGTLGGSWRSLATIDSATPVGSATRCIRVTSTLNVRVARYVIVKSGPGLPEP